MKLLIALCVLGSAAAYPRPDQPRFEDEQYRPERASPPYRPAAPAYHLAPEDKLPPQPYQYQYGVADGYSGTNFEAVQEQDAAGTVIGSYRVNLPDGRVQLVTIHADHQNGAVYDVKYEGEAQFPPEPEEGYGNSYKLKKGYAPAPRPAYKPAPPPYRPA